MHPVLYDYKVIIFLNELAFPLIAKMTFAIRLRMQTGENLFNTVLYDNAVYRTSCLQYCFHAEDIIYCNCR